MLVGTVMLSTLVSLDGDGTTTIMICCAALLPVYQKLDINRAWLALGSTDLIDIGEEIW